MADIGQLQQQTAVALQLDLTDDPIHIVEKTRDDVTLARDGGKTLDENLVAGLAVTLGEQ